LQENASLAQLGPGQTFLHGLCGFM